MATIAIGAAAVPGGGMANNDLLIDQTQPGYHHFCCCLRRYIEEGKNFKTQGVFGFLRNKYRDPVTLARAMYREHQTILETTRLQHGEAVVIDILTSRIDNGLLPSDIGDQDFVSPILLMSPQGQRLFLERILQAMPLLTNVENPVSPLNHAWRDMDQQGQARYLAEEIVFPAFTRIVKYEHGCYQLSTQRECIELVASNIMEDYEKKIVRDHQEEVAHLKSHYEAGFLFLLCWYKTSDLGDWQKAKYWLNSRFWPLDAAAQEVFDRVFLGKVIIVVALIVHVSIPCVVVWSSIMEYNEGKVGWCDRSDTVDAKIMLFLVGTAYCVRSFLNLLDVHQATEFYKSREDGVQRSMFLDIIIHVIFKEVVRIVYVFVLSTSADGMSTFINAGALEFTLQLDTFAKWAFLSVFPPRSMAFLLHTVRHGTPLQHVPSEAPLQRVRGLLSLLLLVAVMMSVVCKASF